MIKLVGATFIFIASVFTGIYLSDTLKRKIQRLVLIRKILREISELIRQSNMTVTEISGKLSENKEFSDMNFIQKLHDKISHERSFQNAWENALNEDSSLNDDEKKLLLEAGAIIGTTDREGQISSLDYYISQIDILTEEQREKYKIKGKMYRSLGIAFGAMIGILII